MAATAAIHPTPHIMCAPLRGARGSEEIPYPVSSERSVLMYGYERQSLGGAAKGSAHTYLSFCKECRLDKYGPNENAK
jgi:hypothetical protein